MVLQWAGQRIVVQRQLSLYCTVHMCTQRCTYLRKYAACLHLFGCFSCAYIRHAAFRMQRSPIILIKHAPGVLVVRRCARGTLVPRSPPLP